MNSVWPGPESVRRAHLRVVQAAVDARASRPSVLQRSSAKAGPVAHGDSAAYEARRASQVELLALTETLIAEYAGQIPAGSVIRCVADAREGLLRRGARAGLATAVETMARARLDLGRPDREIAP